MPRIIESATSAVRAENVLGGYLTQLASMMLGAEGWDRWGSPCRAMLERTHATISFLPLFLALPRL